MGVTIDSRGIVITPGSGLTINGVASVSGLLTATSGTIGAQIALSANTVLTTGGVYTLSSSSAAIKATLPAASTVPGALFIFRAASAHAHQITGSNVAVAGTKTICDVTGSGTRLALPATVNTSVALLCDGVNFLVHGQSGSFVISTPSA